MSPRPRLFAPLVPLRPPNVLSFKPSNGKLFGAPVIAPRLTSPADSETPRSVILSVDDEETVLWTRQQILETAGYRVLNASDGRQALDCVANHNVDLVLLDYVMPEIDGGVVALYLKTRIPAIPVIMVSASPLPPDIRLLADAVIEKGEGPRCLLNTIREFLPSVPCS